MQILGVVLVVGEAGELLAQLETVEEVGEAEPEVVGRVVRVEGEGTMEAKEGTTEVVHKEEVETETEEGVMGTWMGF